MNEGILDLFEKMTLDIIYKMNDEDLINRSRSIKLGYNNVNVFKDETSPFTEYNKSIREDDLNHNKDNKSHYSGTNNDIANEENSNFSNCCKVI